MFISQRKQVALATIESVFDQFIQSEYNLACGAGCAVCCTQDICATTLEADRVVTSLKQAGREDLIEKANHLSAEGGLFRPKVTTNTLAYACLTRNDPPEETPPPDPGVCPFLENDRCVVYEARPFSCRGMVASETCQPGGEAVVPPELVTIVSLMWQVIEHLDAGGAYGNLYDLTAYLADGNHAFHYRDGGKVSIKGLPPTRPVPGFLVPPEHEAVVKRFLDQLFNAECGGGTFKEFMGGVRNSPF